MNSFVRFLGLILLGTAVAYGHPGHQGEGFLSGLSHPMSFIDALVLMAVGAAAVSLSGRSRWAVGGAFVAAIGVGAVTGLPSLPHEIAASLVLVIIGSLLTFAPLIPRVLSFWAAVFSGLIYGFDHGTELATGAGSAGFFAGLLLGCAVLAGIGAGARIELEKLGLKKLPLRPLGMLLMAIGVLSPVFLQ